MGNLKIWWKNQTLIINPFAWVGCTKGKEVFAWWFLTLQHDLCSYLLIMQHVSSPVIYHIGNKHVNLSLLFLIILMLWFTDLITTDFCIHILCHHHFPWIFSTWQMFLLFHCIFVQWCLYSDSVVTQRILFSKSVSPVNAKLLPVILGVSYWNGCWSRKTSAHLY